jgi:ADP-ribosylglycohydrolase
MGNFIGAIAGDILGSTYEWHNTKEYGIDWFRAGSKATDDSVLTCAVASWLMCDKEATNEVLAASLRGFANAFPDAGYGSKFRKWLNQDNDEPIGSYGNGSGMRCSAVGYFARNYEECLELAEKSAAVTHNHEEGIKGAKAISLGVYLACCGYDKEDIKAGIERECGYNLNKSISDFVTMDDKEQVVWRAHKFDATCQTSVPEAIIAFLESTSFEDAIEKACFIGGDTDTIACMAGALAGAYYGVPQWIEEEVISILPEKLFDVVVEFETFIAKRNRKLLRDEGDRYEGDC